MPTGRNAILRLNAKGGIPVRDVRDLLEAFELSYMSLCAFEDALLHPGLLRRDNDLSRDIADMPTGERIRTLADPSLPWRPIAAYSLVQTEYRLVLRAVQLASPGFWDFLGKLSPLEVMRLYLQDRHERRKDREYREAAERERLFWENKARQISVIDQAIEVARKHGASGETVQQLVERFIAGPLSELDTYQDHGVIAAPEFLEPVGDDHG